MRGAIWLALGLASACSGFPSNNAPPSGLSGFAATSTTDALAPDPARRLAALGGGEDPYGGMQVRADLAPAPGAETVLASYQQGLAVLDREGHLLARAPGFDPTGSGDELVSLAVGDGGLDTPLVVATVMRGGHNVRETSVILYRVGARGRLEQLFAGVIEEAAGDDVSTGALELVPGGLRYRAPRETTVQAWTFDRERGRYVE